MKTKTQARTAPAVALRRVAVVAAVLLTLCLVFMMPVGAEGTALPDAVDGVITLDSDVTLENDVTLEEGQSIKVSSDITLNLNGHTITGNSNSQYGLLYVGIGGDLTITGSGEIKNTCEPYESDGYTYNGVVIGNYGKLTINGGTFTGGHALYNMNFQGTTTGLAVIEDGVFQTSNDDDTAAILNCGSLEIKKGTISGLDSSSKLFISGGTIKALLVREPDYPLNPEFGSSTQITSGTIGSLQYVDEVDPHETELNQLTISGGTISNWKGAALSPYYLTGTEILENNYKISITGGAFTVSDDASLKTIINSLADDGDAETRPVIQIDAEEDINIDEQLDIEAPVKIVGVGDTKPTITCSVEKLFRVHADADFENLELVNSEAKGRCIDTRVGGITVNIENCVLTAGGTNSQPLTISYDVKPADGVVSTVTLSGTTINAGDSGYSISTHVPVTLDVQASSELSGYAALDLHNAADVTVTGSTLTGVNKHESADGWNSFGVIAIGAENVHVTLVSGTVGYAKTENTAEEAIILFIKNNGNSCADSSVTINSGVTLEKNGDNAVFEINYDPTKESISVNEGVTSNFLIDSKYLDTTNGNLACVATKTDANGVVTEYTVQAVSEETVVPETPDVGVTAGTTTDVTGESVDVTIITPAASSETTITKTENDNEVVLKPTTESPVSIIISGVDTTAAAPDNSMSSVAIPETAEITAVFEKSTENDKGVTVQLSIKIDNVTKALPVIDTKIDETVEDVIPVPVKKILGMLTALGDTTAVNANIKEDKAVILTFSIPEGIDLNKVKAYHVKDGQNPKEMDWEIVTIEGKDFIRVYGTEKFSSYVLVEEEPAEEEIIHDNGGAVDTGAGNYQYYPRDVPTNGIISFGTSKVVTGMELPAGSDGTVTLNIKPTFAMPENGFYAFEIDAPGYNLDAKINGGLSFQIPVADLEAAGWTAEDIVLFHGTVGEDGKIVWEALPTNLVKNENGIAYYKAAINSCSPFYIGFVKEGSVVNTDVVEPTVPETPEQPVTPDEPEVLPPVEEPTEEPETPASPAPILAVFAGLGAVVALRRK